MEQVKKHESVGAQARSLGRRDLVKLGLGAGVAMTVLKAQAPAQQGQQPPMPPTAGLAEASSQNVQRWPDISKSEQVAATTQTGYTVWTGPGWVNNSGRASGNGPMDE